MRRRPRRQIEQYRLKTGPYASKRSMGCNGMFQIHNLRVLASDGEGWDHVSVSCEDRCPTWLEMSMVKDFFWDDDETVIQYHPVKSEHVNYHPYCLHLWKPQGIELPKPPTILVGPK